MSEALEFAESNKERSIGSIALLAGLIVYWLRVNQRCLGAQRPNSARTIVAAVRGAFF